MNITSEIAPSSMSPKKFGGITGSTENPLFTFCSFQYLLLHVNPINLKQKLHTVVNSITGGWVFHCHSNHNAPFTFVIYVEKPLPLFYNLRISKDQCLSQPLCDSETYGSFNHIGSASSRCCTRCWRHTEYVNYLYKLLARVTQACPRRDW